MITQSTAYNSAAVPSEAFGRGLEWAISGAMVVAVERPATTCALSRGVTSVLLDRPN